MKEKILETLTEKYGMNMRIKEIASVLRITPASLRNKIYYGKFPVPTWSSGRYILASTDDVAEYISTQQDQAKKLLDSIRESLEL